MSSDIHDPSRSDAAPSMDLVDRLPALLAAYRDQVHRAIVGQERVIHELLIAIICGGHALLEGVPGLAKTLLVHSMASAMSLRYGRVQFTPDLMPSDVTGTLVMGEDPRSGRRRFAFRPGPIFVHMLLADEINRTPPKTQAALLEGMNERQVTVGGERHELPRPFFVLATQNPIEQEGTYPLPEAQLDRFLLKILVDYPRFAEEAEIVARTTGVEKAEIVPVLTAAELLGIQAIVRSLPVSDHVRLYATRLVRATRPDDPMSPPWARELIAWGAGPRATQALILAAKAHTLATGRYSVTRGDVRDVAFPVLRHRVIPSFQADGSGIGTDDLIARLLVETAPFPANHRHDPVAREILRL